MKCLRCDGRGGHAYEAGCAGYGDPETAIVIETCDACGGTGEAVCACGEKAAVVCQVIREPVCYHCAALNFVDRWPRALGVVLSA